MSTATLTIMNLGLLTRAPDHQQALEDVKRETDLLVTLSITDAEGYVPPILPAMILHFRPDRKEEIKRQLDAIEQEYEDIERSAEPQRLLASNKARILQRVWRIGTQLSGIDGGGLGYLMGFLIRGLRPACRVKHLILCTNDSSVPWQWLFDDTSGQYLCELFGLGTIYAHQPERMQSILERWVPPIPATERRPRKALIIAGNWDVVNDPADNSQEDDRPIIQHLQDLASTLVQPCVGGSQLPCPDGFIKDNVLIFSRYYGQHQGDRAYEDLLQFLAANEDDVADLALIHYVGHFENDSIVFDRSRCIRRPVLEGLNLRATPLVFLNGCGTGFRPGGYPSELWRTGAPFATILLNRNASGVVVTLQRVSNFDFSFAMSFYSDLLSGEDVGTAMRRARRTMREQDSNNPERLYFQLYGDPRTHLEPWLEQRT